ncbi:uncharacterized protein [Epargyreus clarus]|uniref:uncharacterized protein n=1 Tax=Epargyreus clarus TaxID=520877 RepID=UPI003C2D872C
MEIIKTICRCCLVEGVHKNLNITYCLEDRKEIYSQMLQECFNIVLATTPMQGNNTICDACVKVLRESLCFKKQVLKAEEEFLRLLQQDGVIDDKSFFIKQEIKTADADDDDVGIDNDMHSDITEPDLKPVRQPPKKRTEQKRSTTRGKAQKKPEGWQAKTVKKLVTRLAAKMSATDIPEGIDRRDMKEIVKTSRNKMKKAPIYKEQKINVLWTSRSSADKSKHRDNLKTILAYSNVTPFRNKSLLGYICGYCDDAFPDPAHLRIHTEDNHKKERLEFKSTFDMTEYNVKLDTTDLTCTLCDEKLTDLNNLKAHLVKSHDKVIHTDIKDHVMQFKLKKGDVYNCAMCTSTYETFKMLKQHMNKHYSNYTCTKCDTAFATKRSLNAHRNTHKEGSFKCDFCEKIFSTRTKKQYHEKTNHLGTRNISNCPYCNVPFKSYYQRNQHMIKVHNSEAQYKCNVCDKGYVLKSLLMYHIKKSHLMERDCQCSECGFRFFSKKALKAHMVKHTGERNYSCEVCHKSYARSYTLREHMRIHNNDRRFKCDVCGTAFVQKCSLKSHLLSHHGISMAACEITSS